MTPTITDDSVCVLCGNEITDHGNNPQPLSDDGKCCDNCNITKVVPARLKNFNEDK